MKIECTLRGVGAFTTQIGDDSYAFKFDDKGRVVCDVIKPRHIKAFLARSDAYRDIEAPLPTPAPVIPRSRPAGDATGMPAQPSTRASDKDPRNPNERHVTRTEAPNEVPFPFDPAKASRKQLIDFLQENKAPGFKISLTNVHMRAMATTIIDDQVVAALNAQAAAAARAKEAETGADAPKGVGDGTAVAVGDPADAAGKPNAITPKE